MTVSETMVERGAKAIHAYLRKAAWPDGIGGGSWDFEHGTYQISEAAKDRYRRDARTILTAALSDQAGEPVGYLIWWTNQSDCERIAPLDTWPMYLYNEYQSREGRNGRGRLWCSDELKGAPEGVTVEWDTANNWLCKAASDAGGIVIKVEHAQQVQYLPGFLTTFEMTLPAPPSPTGGGG